VALEPWTLDRIQALGGTLGIPVHVIMDCTLREIDNYARGADLARRSELAAMLWGHHSAAGFFQHVYAGKRLPNIDRRLQQIMTPPDSAKRHSEVADVVERMNMIAMRAGMPPPRPRAKTVH